MNTQPQFIPLSFKEKMLMAFFSIITALSFLSMLKGCEGENTRQKNEKTITQLSLRNAKLNQSYLNTLSKFRKQESTLNDSISLLKASNTKLRQRVKKSMGQFYALRKKSEDSLFVKNAPAFDSLAEHAKNAIQDLHQADSLNQRVVFALTRMCVLKDSMLCESETAYNQLRAYSDSLLEQYARVVYQRDEYRYQALRTRKQRNKLIVTNLASVSALAYLLTR